MFHLPRFVALSILLLPSVLPAAEPPFEPLSYRLQLDVVSEGYRDQKCWFHPRAGAIPGNPSTVVLTVQPWWIKASDLFLPIHSLESRDLGKTWSAPVEHAQTLGRHTLDDGAVEGICDFTPKWHAASGKLLGTGQTVRYRDDKLVIERPRATVWSVYQTDTRTWTPWQTLAMPEGPKFYSAGAGSTQRVDLPNGDILLPVYFKGPNTKAYASTVVRCRFDGEKLMYVEHGSEHTNRIDRGLYEPSLALFQGRYYLTLRNDRAAYVAVSDDGLHFSEPKKWTFDDGADLGSYNTQAHWVVHSKGLFLSYTRRGAGNDKVMRHRAPLFLAQVDPQRLVIVRATEKELVPNRGAQLGNFAVVDVSEHETWVTTSEGMTPLPKDHTANGRVYAARLLWDTPNEAWDKH